MSVSRFTVALLLAALTVPESHGQSCQTGWFGLGCIFKCHCALSYYCESDGSCPRNGSCAPGYFGPGCQYLDLAQLYASPDVPSYLNDRNDKTCLDHIYNRRTYLPLKDIVYGSWFRITVSDPVRLMWFTLRINTYYSCSDEVRHIISPKVVDVICSTGFLIRDLLITGMATERLCTINISGGRNIALKQFVNQSSTYYRLGEASNAVDGNTERNFERGSCARTNSGLRPRWSLGFALPTKLLRAVLTNSDTNTLKEFTLQAYSDTGRMIFSYTYPYRLPQATYEVSLLSTNHVSRLEILGTADYPQRENALQFCEIEVYGDYWHPGRYGLSRDRLCRCRAGEHCSENHGVCTPTCPQGRFGKGCARQCDKACLGNRCEPQTGICYSCIGRPFDSDFCLSASTQEPEDSRQSYLWVLVPVAVIMLVAPIGLYLCLHRKKKTRQPNEVAVVSATAPPP